MLELIAAFFIQPSFATQQAQVIVRPLTLSFQTAEVELGQIAEFIGFPVDEELRLSRIRLGQPPEPGTRRSFSNKDLSHLFRTHLNRKTVKNVRLQIPSQIHIEHPGFAITEDLIKAQLLGQWRKQCADCRFELTDLSLPRIANHTEKNPWKLMPTPEVPRGPFSAQLRVSPTAGQDQIYWVTGRVKVLRYVPAVKRAFSTGEGLSPDDVEWQWRETTLATDRAPTEAELIDKRVRQSMRAGDILYVGMLERNKLIKRGELVQAMSLDDYYQVSLVAQSEQDGYLGDLIKVKNRESNKVLSGRVSGKGEVRIE